ncbi:glycosyltransferase family 25 protein [Caballeronia sp. BR00000012568055]|uniref:glycosyltransferase family 25 protein n=1 Tax=Caballeronia sp. BR00000012568055 TaxID=2918761 RepID=UPI0023FA1F9D|nr:glycosyltransferase family 25 protein [Caballeronia sp. BR00000012568055]
MHIYFINLEIAEDRRAVIETNLRQFAGSEHQVIRVPAYDARYIEINKVGGTLRQNEKACLLSHMRAIEMSLDDPGPSLILEDDALIGTRTTNLLRQFTPDLDQKDIVFTDLCIPTALWMMRLFKLRRTLNGTVALFDTAQLDFRRLHCIHAECTLEAQTVSHPKIDRVFRCAL